MTTTELAHQLADDPRFATDGSSLFEETAAKYGQDFAGLAFTQAFLKLAGYPAR